LLTAYCYAFFPVESVVFGMKNLVCAVDSVTVLVAYAEFNKTVLNKSASGCLASEAASSVEK
jgi:hypothetical protein